MLKNMMASTPSLAGNKRGLRGSRVISVVLASMFMSACVAQSDLLAVDTTQKQVTPQLGLASQNTGDANLAQGSDLLLPNVPQRAPRGSSVPTEVVSAQTNGRPAVSAGTTNSRNTVNASATPASSTVLAAVDPNPATIPAETVINTATTATTTVNSTQEATKPAPATAEVTQETAKQVTGTATVASAPSAPSQAAPAAKKPEATGLFARLFQNNSSPKKEKRTTRKRVNQRASGRGEDDGVVRIASAHAVAKKKKTVRKTATLTRRGQNGALPGVKNTSQLFGLSEDNTSKPGANTPNVTQVAAVGSLGRLSPNGIRVQHDKVQVACLKPGILRMLKQVERKYGRKPIVTSGYRSPKRNRRAGGAKNSMHIYCKAADIQVEGVSKWQLAKYLRSIPGRGGVGTYCRTKSVHIDTGSKRDWHHPCRRSSKRKKRKT